jgi:hypothetical protein
MKESIGERVKWYTRVNELFEGEFRLEYFYQETPYFIFFKKEECIGFKITNGRVVTFVTHDNWYLHKLCGSNTPVPMHLYVDEMRKTLLNKQPYFGNRLQVQVIG